MIVCVCEWLCCALNAFPFAPLFAGGRVLFCAFWDCASAGAVSNGNVAADWL